MADQYHIFTRGLWQSQCGNGIIALANKTDSGKVIKIHNVGVQINTPLGASTNFANIICSYRISDYEGQHDIGVYKLDTNSPDLPSDIIVGTRGTFTSTHYSSGNYFKRLSYHQSLALTTNGLSKVMGAGLIGNNSQMQYSENLTTCVPLTFVQDEGFAVIMEPNFFRIGVYYRIDCTFVATIDSVDHTYFTSVITSVDCEDTPMFAIMNKNSSISIKLLRLNCAEAGDGTTPYFALVPIAGINSFTFNDDLRKVPIIKMDTTSPDIDTVLDAYFDTPVLPQGVPDSYLSEASVSFPKGFNYLHVKDFIGPIYHVQFAEFYSNTFVDTLATTPFCANISRKAQSLWSGPQPIILRPGEGVAVISSSENVLSTTNSVFLTSWGGYFFSVQFSVESTSYSLTITGLQTNSEVRIYTHNTTTELGGIENSSTSFAYNYTYSPSTYVDIIILHPDYQYYKITNLLLESSNSTVPVQQVLDRVYNNP